MVPQDGGKAPLCGSHIVGKSRLHLSELLPGDHAPDSWTAYWMECLGFVRHTLMTSWCIARTGNLTSRIWIKCLASWMELGLR